MPPLLKDSTTEKAKSWKNGQKDALSYWKNGQKAVYLPWKNGQIYD
jgi:hypothetical protein